MMTANSDDYVSVTLNHVLTKTATVKCVYRLLEQVIYSVTAVYDSKGAFDCLAPQLDVDPDARGYATIAV